MRRDCVDVGRIRAVRQRDAGGARLLGQLLDEVVRALAAFALEHGLERVEPLLRLKAVGIVGRGLLRNGGHGFLLLGLG